MSDLDGANASFEIALRYRGQTHPIFVALDANGSTLWVDVIPERFAERHRQLYGYRQDDASIEVVEIRTKVTRSGVRPDMKSAGNEPTETASVEQRTYFRDEGWTSLPVVERSHLSGLWSAVGPVIITDYSGTTVVEPGWSVSRDETGHLVLEPTEVER